MGGIGGLVSCKGKGIVDELLLWVVTHGGSGNRRSFAKKRPGQQ